jgi:hypothetical protein
MKVGVMHAPTSSIWKYDESTIVIGFLYFQMDRALICINVLKKFHAKSHER